MMSFNPARWAPYILFASTTVFLFSACDKAEQNATVRLSGVGESCLKTSDCVETAKCVEQRCTLSTTNGDAPAAPATLPTAGSGSGAASAPGTTVAQPPAPAAAAPAEPEYEDEPCTHIGHMLGTWSFTSLGILADEPGKGAVNGYYRIFIERAMDCTVNAKITKTGFGRHTFTPEKYQVGELSLDPMGGGAALSDTYGGAVTIIRPDGSARVDMSFSFRFDGDTLTGVWHYLGDSWNTMNMTGVLLGRRSASDRPSLPSIETVGRPLACAAYACTPRVNGARGGFDCGPEYDRCVASRQSLSTFSTTSQGTMRAAAVEQVPKGRSLSGVGNALVSSLAKNDYGIASRTLLNMDDALREAELGAGRKMSAEENAEARGKFSTFLREINANSRRQWDAARTAGIRAGIIWSEVKLQGTSSKVNKGDEMYLEERATTQFTFRGTPYSLEYTVVEFRKTGNIYLFKDIKLAL